MDNYVNRWLSRAKTDIGVPALAVQTHAYDAMAIRLVVAGTPSVSAVDACLDGADVLVPADIFRVECSALSDWLSVAYNQPEPGYRGFFSLHGGHVVGVEHKGDGVYVVVLGLVDGAGCTFEREAWCVDWMVTSVIGRANLGKWMDVLEAFGPKSPRSETPQ